MPPGTCSPSAFPAAPSRSGSSPRSPRRSTSRSPRSPSASRTTGRSVSTGFSSAAPASCKRLLRRAAARLRRRRPLVVYPLARGTGPLVAVALAIALVGERPTLLTMTGALTISAGTLLLATPVRSERHQRVASASVSRPGSSSASTRSGTATRSARARYRRADVLGGRSGQAALAGARGGAAARPDGRHWRSHRAAILALGVLSPSVLRAASCSRCNRADQLDRPAREISIVAGTLSA